MGSGNLLLLKTRYFKDGCSGAQCSRVTWPRMPWAISGHRTLYHASGGESKVFYQRMVADCYRYIAKLLMAMRRLCQLRLRERPRKMQLRSPKRTWPSPIRSAWALP
ncbi:unnamed protein product [Polarella glacialis]|uniref:Uncharacterized protein n=1 Tax=Polarella glacialis TaxID=89957 RepID=A0A813I214_POLGL|nr:unnamed protein product [Polarella glacialis]